MFEITDMREVDSNGLVKILRAAGEGLAPEKSQKIAKIVATLEDNPLNAAIEYKSRGKQSFRKSPGIDAVSFESFKVNSCSFEQIDGISDRGIASDVEP